MAAGNKFFECIRRRNSRGRQTKDQFKNLSIRGGDRIRVAGQAEIYGYNKTLDREDTDTVRYAYVMDRMLSSQYSVYLTGATGVGGPPYC